MTKIFTAILAAALALLLITCTAYAYEEQGASEAEADLNFEITVEEGFYIKVGSAGTTVDTIYLSIPAVGDGWGHMFAPVSLNIVGNVAPGDSVYLTAATDAYPLQNSLGELFSPTGNGWGDINVSGSGDFTFNTSYDGTGNQLLESWTGSQTLSGSINHSFTYPAGDTRPYGVHIGTVRYTVDALP